ncbi:MAG: FxLYD domain-containing protein [Chrysiogenia bacterium]
MKKTIILLVSFLILLVTLQSCKTSDEATPPIVLRKPVINSFTADNAITASGFPVVLTWSVSNAVTCEIDNGIGQVASSGTVTIVPRATTIYTLTATNTDGGTTKQLKIEVRVLIVSWYKKFDNFLKIPYIDGTVKNVGEKGVYNMGITFTAYNSSNTIIDTAQGFPADLATINPGDSAIFKAYFFKLNSWTGVAKINISISWLNLQGIKEVLEFEDIL